jgi:hypothetical protein
MWSIVLYDAGICALRKIDQNYLENIEIRNTGEGWRRAVGPLL